MGEIQRFKAHPSGHQYFELVEKGDRDAIVGKLDAVIWRGDYARLRAALERAGERLADGLKIRCLAAVDFYPPHGKLQLHVGLAVTTGSLSDEYEDVDGTYTDEVSVLALIAAPGVSFVTFESDDHRARLLLQGRFLVGTLNASGGDGERSQDALVLGAAGSALGEYRVHSSFGTGIEAGYGLAFASSSEGSSKTSASMTGLFVAFTGTIYLGGN